MGKSTEMTPKAIRGFVLPVGWDDDDRFTHLAITTNEGEEYIVDENELAEDLTHCLDEQVLAEGLVYTDDDAHRHILVRRYKLVRTARR